MPEHRRTGQPAADHQDGNDRAPAAPATVSSDRSSSPNSYWLCGTTNVWLARTREMSTMAPPPSPKIPVPGTTKTSVSRQATPARNSVISSQKAVPGR